MQPSNFIFENIKVGDLSTKDIFAPNSISYVDKKATQQLKDEALEQVEDVYDLDKQPYQKAEEDMKTFLSSISDTKKAIQEEKDKQKDNESFDVDAFTTTQVTSMSNPFGFDNKYLKDFIKEDDKALTDFSNVLLKELENILNNTGVTEDQVESIRTKFEKTGTDNDSLLEDKETAFLLTQKVAERIVTNFKLNKEETTKREKEALEKVEPVYKQIKKGEKITEVGKYVTEEQMEKLKQLGLTDAKFNYSDLLIQLPYVAFVLFLFHFYCFKFYNKEFQSFRKYSFVLALITFVLLLSNFIESITFFVVPVLTVMMIFMVIWGRKFIIPLATVIGLLVYSNEFIYFTLTVVAGFVLAIHYKPGGERMDLIRTGIVVGVIFVLSQLVLVYSLDNEMMQISVIFPDNLWLVVSSFFSAIVTIGIIPVVEKYLGIVTLFRLQEYNKQDHPLIKQLTIEAPGTYHHSVMVGNLAEIAADEIGANGLLLRIAAYYHDVGKMKNAQYFIENSTPDSNPHQYLSPKESAKIILNHPIESVKMCKEYKLPEPIINLVASHHSDGILENFYQQEIAKNGEANIEDFRYKSPTPKTKEEGILMLADSTEAFSRVLLERGVSFEELEQKIRQSIYDKIKNGNLRNCALTLDEIETIIKKFISHLSKMNHRRIEYDEKK
jgi:putative nucleotidyltransferase with HDIG domain